MARLKEQREKVPEKKSAAERRTTKTAIFVEMIIFATLFASNAVFASGADVVTAKFDILKNIIASIISSIGIIITLWGIFEVGNSMQMGEGGATSQAMKRVGGGLVMVVAPQLLTLLV